MSNERILTQSRLDELVAAKPPQQKLGRPARMPSYLVADEGRSVEIRLQSGHSVFIEAADVEIVAGQRWYAKTYSNTTYVNTFVFEGGKKVSKMMHRMLMGFPAEEVDHRDGSGLNNRRSNLRRATHAKNVQNNHRRKPGKYKYKGVTRERSGVNCWKAYAQLNGKRYYKWFPTEEQAARGYDDMAKELFGEFASLNFPEESPAGSNNLPGSSPMLGDAFAKVNTADESRGSSADS